MKDYYKKQRHLVFPNQSEMQGLRQQIGRGGVGAILEGSNLLVIYWAIRYQGFRKDKEYATFYLGYCDKDILAKQQDNFVDFKGMTGYTLREFAIWAKDGEKKIK